MLHNNDIASNIESNNKSTNFIVMQPFEHNGYEYEKYKYLCCICIFLIVIIITLMAMTGEIK